MFEEPIYPFQASFSKGEVSPDLFGRVDLQAYTAGLRTSRNAFIRTEGSWSNRPGTQFCAASLSNTPGGSILIPFSFSVGQSYVIEIATGSNGIQVFYQGNPLTGVTPAATVSNVQDLFVPGVGNCCVITTAAPHGLAVGQNVAVAGIVGNAQAQLQNGNWVVSTNPILLTATSFVTNAPYAGGASYTSGGTVSVINEFASPYAQSELTHIRWAQSANTLTIVHPNHPPYEFIRTGASTFTFQAAVYTAGPFNPTNTDGVTLVYASAQQGTVTLTASSAIFNANHVGGLFYMEQQDVAPVLPWEPEKIYWPQSAAVGPIGFRIRSNLKNYVCVAGGNNGTNNCATGTIAPDHTIGTQWDGSGTAVPSFAAFVGVGWEYTDPGYGVVLITTYNSPTSVTGTVMPITPGQPAYLPYTVVGGPLQSGNITATYNFTGNGSSTTFNPLGSITAADPNRFYVTIAGVYQPPANYSINLSGQSISFLTAPAFGAAIVVSQMQWSVGPPPTCGGLFATTFWAFGAFSAANGYPGAVTYFPDRLILAGTTSQPVGVFGSQTSNYHDFAYSVPGVNSDAFTVFLNARELNAISDLIPLQDLIVGTANIMWRLWPGNTGTALGPESIDATPQVFTGQHPGCRAVLYGDSMIYPIYGGRRIRDMMYQFQFDKYVGGELTAYSRHLFPYGTSCASMMYAPDPWGQVFALSTSGQLNNCTYVREQQMIAWSRWDTGTAAAPGSFDAIAVVPENNLYTLYVICNRTINGANVRYFEKLTNWEAQTIYDYKFMDASLTYDGRNTSLTTMTLTGGTTWLSGDTGVLTASGTSGWATFINTDPQFGNAIQLFDANGVANNTPTRVLITALNSSTQVTVRFIDPIPADLQGQPVNTWTFARTTFGGINHLANQQVAVYADGNVLCGTQGAPYLTVSSLGAISLPNPCGVVCVGLQYFSDFESLALNQQGQQTIRARAKGTPGLYLDVNSSRGLLSGSNFTQMAEIKEREFETYLSPTNLQNGIIKNLILSEFDSESHICVRQPYPLPATIRMVIPTLNIGEPSA